MGRDGAGHVIFAMVGPERWGACLPHLLPAIEWSGEFTVEDVEDQVRSGKAQLWAGEDDQVRCAVVTQLRETANGLVCDLWLMGGKDRRLWLHFLKDIEIAAKERGCIGIEIIGRQGWGRVLKDYQQTAIVMRKAL